MTEFSFLGELSLLRFEREQLFKKKVWNYKVIMQKNDNKQC